MKIKIPLLTPFSYVPQKVMLVAAIVEIAMALLAWQMTGGGLIPGPSRVLKAMGELLRMSDFSTNLMASLVLTFKGMVFSIVPALIICYMGTIPIFRPIVKFISQCRYLTLTGLIFLFTLLTKDGSSLKISLLLFGIIPFFVTSFASIMAGIKTEEYDLCTTLRFNKWETLFRVVIRGRIDQAFEVMRQNFAISWLMITMVEGLSMSEGGLGVALIRANKILDLPKVFAVMIIIFVMGLAFDFILNFLRQWLFPYCRLQVSK
jgi:ABC-type nitrate/sulfonate/bicarbonate transport system permease component